VDAFVEAFQRGDVTALVRLLAEDVRFTMPPLPAWFDGRDEVSEFFAQRVFATAWRAVPLELNSQPAFAGYQQVSGTFRLGAVNVLSFRAGKVSWIASFLDPAVQARLGLPAQL
jgi:RNA polymerase sigma-70 factor (ECF subfamily)